MPIPTRLRPALALTALLAFSGCGSLLGSGPVQGFELRTAEPVRAARQTSRQITVEVPETSGALATDRILIRPTGIEASYLPDTQWTNEAPRMVQTLILRGLQQSGGYAYAGRKPLGLSGDYAILTELTDLQAEIVDENTVIAKVGMTLQIVRESDARVIASRSFTQTAPSASDKAADVTRALDAGMRSILPKVTSWVLQNTGAGTAR